MPPQAPMSETSSMIGISIELDKYPFLPNSHPWSVLFVRVKENQDYLQGELFYPSNYTYRNMLFLLNAEPGRYYAVVAFDEEEANIGSTIITSKNTYYFPIALISNTGVNVKTNSAVYMGHYIADVPAIRWISLENPDEAQRHFCKKLQPEKASFSVSNCCGESCMRLFGSGSSVLAATMRKSEKDIETEIKFWMKAKELFKSDAMKSKYYKKEAEASKGWIAKIEKRLLELKDAQRK